jgi:hypothetical protein
MDRQGKKLVHTNIKNNDFTFFLKLVAPYQHDIQICSITCSSSPMCERSEPGTDALKGLQYFSPGQARERAALG